jgi:hypothetical protein
MSEQLTYRTLDELRALSVAELTELWELVPTERQRLYRAAYERELRNAGASGSDTGEAQVAAELSRRYAEDALVPVGGRWARTPQRVQDAARDDTTLSEADDNADKVARKPSPTILALLAVPIVLMFGFLLLRNDGTAPPTASTAPPTATPEVSVTPTPIAFNDPDGIVDGGDPERSVAYPVSLHITLTDDNLPRVWVVQRRAVRAAEWRYDPNPDIASFVNGLSVRPVVGVPHSPENTAWFERIGPGTRFRLTMNTGAVRDYVFTSKAQVRRSDTAALRQVSPGLVLLLIGETDAEGLPTGTRTLVTADYPQAQELSRAGDLLLADAPPTPLPSATPTPDVPDFAGLAVQVVRVETQPGRLTTQLRLYNGDLRPLRIGPDDLWLTLGYAPRPAGPRLPAEGLTPFMLLPEQAADVTLVWRWDGETYASLSVFNVVYAGALLS